MPLRSPTSPTPSAFGFPPLPGAATDSRCAQICTNIVGSCANSAITQQNYIGFIYGAMSAAGVAQRPSVDDVIGEWSDSIKTWAATGDTVPYKNFNDGLHYANS
ncbi:hypothetical protein B0H10DRAFT_1791709 [Mycena sp. CBHHK59/15]|nr:hypothetical protein B0H10DRAFT_1791709 [Mycena sp. CBHHK59/15]